MNIGTAGVPIDLATSRDYDAIFSALAEAGMDVYFPNSTYQEYPISLGNGFEADLLPPPFGTATPAIYDLAREHGIKIAFSADYMFPLANGGVDVSNSPLQAIIDAGGRDIIYAVANYDEPAWNGLDPDLSRAVYEHVQSIDPSISVVQVHAPVTDSDATLYLDQVRAHAQWADEVGFNVYPIGAESGARTPYRPDQIVSPAEALEDYVAWLENELGDHDHVMVLQGFERLDLYSDALVSTFSDQQIATSRPPTLLEMREMMLAVQGVDTVYWWGASLQEEAGGEIWQNIVQVSQWASNDQLGTDMGPLSDSNAASNRVSEDADQGDLVGITLSADEPDAIDIVTYTIDDPRFEVDADGRVTVAENASFDYETESTLTIVATASSTDGTVQTFLVELSVTDVIDEQTGSMASDSILGQSGEDLIFARGGDDLINTLNGDDTINGGRGDDIIYGGDGDDVLRGQADDDIIWDEAGNDRVHGGAGNDILIAGAGNDHIDGATGADQIIALSGDNTLIGGRGDDQMQAGTGADEFVFHQGDGSDYIFGFDVTMDSLAFEDATSMDDIEVTSYGASATQIDYDGGSILIFGVSQSELASDNFDFG